MTDPQARIRQLEIENGRLLDQVDVLKSALVDVDAPLPRAWRLTRSEAHVMRLLMKREVATTDALMAVLYSDRSAPPDPQVIRVWVSRMRRKLEGFGISITPVWGVGYSLDAATRAAFKEKEAA